MNTDQENKKVLNISDYESRDKTKDNIFDEVGKVLGWYMITELKMNQWQANNTINTLLSIVNNNLNKNNVDNITKNITDGFGDIIKHINNMIDTNPEIFNKDKYYNELIEKREKEIKEECNILINKEKVHYKDKMINMKNDIELLLEFVDKSSPVYKIMIKKYGINGGEKNELV